MSTPACTACRSVALEPGFVEDSGDSSLGYARWIPGPLVKGFFGGAKRMGKPRHTITAHRCTACGHLELYVADRRDVDDS
jgi:hypothetical protein